MGVEFLLVLGLIIVVSTMVPTMAHADDDRPDPDKEARAKQANQALDQRALEQSRRLTREAQQRAAIEKQTAADRLLGLENASEKTANFSQQLTDLGQQTAAVSINLETSDVSKQLLEIKKETVGMFDGMFDGPIRALEHAMKSMAPGEQGAGLRWAAGTAGLALTLKKLRKRKARAKKIGDEAEEALRKKKPGATPEEIGLARKDAVKSKRKGFMGSGTAGFLGGYFGAGGSEMLNKFFEGTKQAFGGYASDLDAAVAATRAFTNLTEKEDPFGAIVQNIYDTSAQWHRYGLEVRDTADLNIQLTETFRRFSRMSPRDQLALMDTSAMMSVLGVETSTSAKNMEIMGNVMLMTADQSAAFTRRLSGDTDALNMNLNQVMGQFSGMEDTIARFGSNAENALGGLMRIQSNLNIPMQKTIGIVEQFKTFDGAATAVGNLNAMLGGEFIDDIALMKAAVKDPAEAMLMIRGALRDTTVDWRENAFAMEGLSETLNIGMADLRRLADGDLDAADRAMAMTKERAQNMVMQGKAFEQLPQVVGRAAKEAGFVGKRFQLPAGSPGVPGAGMRAQATALALKGARGINAETSLAHQAQLAQLLAKIDANMEAEKESKGGHWSDETIAGLRKLLAGTPVTLNVAGEKIMTELGFNKKMGGR